MDMSIAKVIIDSDNTMTDEQLSVLVLRAREKALNHHYWHPDDIPTDEQAEAFFDKYEFQIYDIAKAMLTDDERNGLTSFSELGVTRSWSGDGTSTAIKKALAEIPGRAYVI